MKPIRSSERGSTLIVAASIMLILVVLAGIALTATSQQNRTAKEDSDFIYAQAAAEGALEYAYASWKQVIRANGLRPPNNSQMDATNLPPPTSSLHAGFQSRGVTFSNFSVVNVNQWGETTDSAGNVITSPATVTVANVPGYPGWSSLTSFYRAQVTATVPSLQKSATLNLARYFQVAGISIFQAAIFFDYDIELHPGPPMTINGLVHTNGDLWVATANANTLQFNSNVSYVGTYQEAYKPSLGYGGGATPPPVQNPPLWADGLPSSTSTSFPTQASRVTRLDPFGTEATSLFDTTDSNTNNDGMREIIEPPNSSQTDPPQIAAIRLYNQATVRVTINRAYPVGNANRVVITNGSNASLPTATDTAIRNALNVSTTTVYDWREGGNVSLTNVDLRSLDTAFSGMGSSFNGVFYIQDVTSTGLNAVRLQNGSTLSNDLTIASNNGVYVQGDYNTGGGTGGSHDPNLIPSNNGGNPLNTDSPVASGYTKRSCAIAADAVMILSNNWQDSNSTKGLSSRVATPTTVNAAIVSGIVPSNYQNSGMYSGGPHNFPRFLETWSGVDLTYFGSLVQLYFSQQFDGVFDTGNIYSPPNRRWNWDSQLGTKPPPGLFQNVQFSRGRWQRL
jgi:Tfp pilus assembly protein PilX